MTKEFFMFWNSEMEIEITFEYRISEFKMEYFSTLGQNDIQNYVWKKLIRELIQNVKRYIYTV